MKQFPLALRLVALLSLCTAGAAQTNKLISWDYMAGQQVTVNVGTNYITKTNGAVVYQTNAFTVQTSTNLSAGLSNYSVPALLFDQTPGVVNWLWLIYRGGVNTNGQGAVNDSAPSSSIPITNSPAPTGLKVSVYSTPAFGQPWVHEPGHDFTVDPTNFERLYSLKIDPL